MQPQPNSTPGQETSALTATSERQEILACFRVIPTAKPALPLKAGLAIRANGETFQATALPGGEAVVFALPALPEKAILSKNNLSAASNVIPQ